MVCYIHFGYENLNGGVYFVQFDDLDIANLNLKFEIFIFLSKNFHEPNLNSTIHAPDVKSQNFCSMVVIQVHG